MDTVCVKSTCDVCGTCAHWDDAQWVRNQYGDGNGLCALDRVVKSCCRDACVCYCPRFV